LNTVCCNENQLGNKKCFYSHFFCTKKINFDRYYYDCSGLRPCNDARAVCNEEFRLRNTITSQSPAFYADKYDLLKQQYYKPLQLSRHFESFVCFYHG
jgi:hypothetical protein